MTTDTEGGGQPHGWRRINARNLPIYEIREGNPGIYSRLSALRGGASRICWWRETRPDGTTLTSVRPGQQGKR